MEQQNIFMGKIIFSNKQGYAIIQDGEGNLYIGSVNGYYNGQELLFNRDNLKKMPSLLYAMVELGNITRQEIKDFIKGEE